MLLSEKPKSSKSEVVAVVEEVAIESSEEFEDSDIYFMVQEDISFPTSYMENPDDNIPDLVDDSNSDDESISFFAEELDLPEVDFTSDNQDLQVTTPDSTVQSLAVDNRLDGE